MNGSKKFTVVLLIALVLMIATPVHADVFGDIIDGFSDIIFGDGEQTETVNETVVPSTEILENVIFDDQSITAVINRDGYSEIIISDNPNVLYTGDTENRVVVRQR